MNILVIAVEMVIFAILFTVMVFATTGKNIETQVHNYPPKIQEEYFKTHEKISVEPLSKRVLVLKGCATSWELSRCWCCYFWWIGAWVWRH